jgi:hypothetical protein
MSRQPQEPALNDNPNVPCVSSQSGGQKVQEDNNEQDRFINFFQDDIKKRDEKIQRANESNRHPQVQGTADFYQLAYFQITFHLEIMNWLDERRIQRLRDPNLSDEDRESIHQVYFDRQKGILRYLFDKIVSLFSMVVGFFSSPKPDTDQLLNHNDDLEEKNEDSSPVVRQRNP